MAAERRGLDEAPCGGLAEHFAQSRGTRSAKAKSSCEVGRTLEAVNATCAAVKDAANNLRRAAFSLEVLLEGPTPLHTHAVCVQGARLVPLPCPLLVPSVPVESSALVPQ